MFLLGTHALDIMCVFHQLLVVFQGNALAFLHHFGLKELVLVKFLLFNMTQFILHDNEIDPLNVVSLFRIFCGQFTYKFDLVESTCQNTRSLVKW